MVANGDRMEVKVSMKRDIRKRRGKGIDLVMKGKTLWQAEGLNATQNETCYKKNSR